MLADIETNTLCVMWAETKEIPDGYCQCGCGQKTTGASQTVTRLGIVKGQPNRFINGHVMPLAKPVAERFWSKVTFTANPHKCWEWVGTFNAGGYGCFGVRGKTIRAHRGAWELTNGPIPSGLDVLHKCDNRACCNPNHLFLGTDLDNMRDRDAKGRQAKGERNGSHKLTSDQVETIRRRHAAGNISATKLAREFGVSGRTVQLIVSGKAWK